jgi:hypothetical protein
MSSCPLRPAVALNPVKGGRYIMHPNSELKPAADDQSAGSGDITATAAVGRLSILVG